jgi:hypothetical protein
MYSMDAGESVTIENQGNLTMITNIKIAINKDMGNYTQIMILLIPQ